MPPSGFNDKAVKGLLTFIEACYEDLLKEMNSGTDGKVAIKKELDEIGSFLRSFTLK